MNNKNKRITIKLTDYRLSQLELLSEWYPELVNDITYATWDKLVEKLLTVNQLKNENRTIN